MVAPIKTGTVFTAVTSMLMHAIDGCKPQHNHRTKVSRS